MPGSTTSLLSGSPSGLAVATLVVQFDGDKGGGIRGWGWSWFDWDWQTGNLPRSTSPDQLGPGTLYIFEQIGMFIALPQTSLLKGKTCQALSNNVKATA